MFQYATKYWLLFSLALFIGSIGAIGQSYMLWHELYNTYPYKMMDTDLYDLIAKIGFYISPIFAILGGFLMGRKRIWLATIIPVVLSPLLFASIFKIVSMLNGLSNSNANFSFDGKNPAMAAQEFYFQSFSLAIIGLVIGLICGFTLFYFSKERLQKLQ